tara:strand:- start:377 stop:910 length:534 start_codon:yes stop_codon:yes gene_type:complete
MKTYGISFGYVGKLHNNVYKTWNILDRKFKINYIKNHSSHPHITLIAGKTANIEKIYKILSKLKIKKFKLHSPGLGLFVNKSPNLFIRWNQDYTLMHNFNLIRKKTSKLFKSKRKFYDEKDWIPRSTLAWKDLNYKNLLKVYKKIGSKYKKQNVLINRIYILQVTNKEILTNTLKLK